MNNLSWFKFCPSKWAMGRTRKLSSDQRDEYLDLCCAYWISECKMSEETMRENTDIYDFFEAKGLVCDDGITWLNEQYDKLNNTRQKRREAGAKGGKAKAKKVVANAKQVLSNSQANPKQIVADRKEEIEEKEKKEEIEENFCVFWDLYDKKVDRAKCFQKWKRLKEIDRAEILFNVRPYVLANPETQYRKNPLTYLNGRCWEDEIIENQKTKQNGFHIEISEEGLENFLNG
jgi:hypothetical protein